MKICIRRGAKEIGGSAVELIANSGQRLIVDLGLPLDTEENHATLLPEIAGLREKTDDLLGVLISHPHQDHYALGLHIDKKIPVYMSRETKAIMAVCVAHHLPFAFSFENIGTFENGKAFSIGDFAITPYLVDHSAYGAYAFLIEADERKLFYSGDFRAHGRKGKLFDAFVHHPPKDVNVLLMEGSCLGRESSERYKSENDLEKEFLSVFKETKGVCLIQASSQNIDRIVTIYRAAKRCGRQLVMSGYTGHILMALENPSLPNFTWSDVKKFAMEKNASHHITKEMIEQNPQDYVVLLGGFIFNALEGGKLLNKDASFIYSMWDGYKELYQNRLDLMKAKNLRMEDIHTSGHADIPSLQKFAKALAPKKIVPIHTFFPEKFAELFDAVTQYGDNEVFDV